MGNRENIRVSRPDPAPDADYTEEAAEMWESLLTDGDHLRLFKSEGGLDMIVRRRTLTGNVGGGYTGRSRPITIIMEGAVNPLTGWIEMAELSGPVNPDFLKWVRNRTGWTPEKQPLWDKQYREKAWGEPFISEIYEQPQQ